jgi:hypothetical protein
MTCLLRHTYKHVRPQPALCLGVQPANDCPETSSGPSGRGQPAGDRLLVGASVHLRAMSLSDPRVAMISVLDHGPGGREPGQVAGLGQDRCGVEGGQAGDGAGQVGQLEFVQHSDHPGLDLGQAFAGVVPVGHQQVDAFERAAAVGDDAGGVGQSRVQVTGDPSARFLPAPVGKGAVDGGLEPVRPRRRVRSRSPPSRSRTTPRAAAQVRDFNGLRAAVNRGSPRYAAAERPGGRLADPS